MATFKKSSGDGVAKTTLKSTSLCTGDRISTRRCRFLKEKSWLPRNQSPMDSILDRSEMRAPPLRARARRIPILHLSKWGRNLYGSWQIDAFNCMVRKSRTVLFRRHHLYDDNVSSLGVLPYLKLLCRTGLELNPLFLSMYICT
jgi:hypothetical protein